MTMASEIRQLLGEEWLPSLYREKVRSQRTRSIALEIPRRINKAEILHTLLGIELKVGRRRIACPDLPTARFMMIFARLGATEFAIPYDITKISPIADELETSWQKTLLYIGERSGRHGVDLSALKRSVIKDIRREIADIGAGEAMPKFDAPASSRRAKK